MGMGIAVIAYNRPDCLARVVRSMESAPESQTLPFHFFLDGGGDAAQEANAEVIRRSSIRNAHVVARDRNLGCEANTVLSRLEMFDEWGYETVLLVEDDLVLSSDYIGLTARLLTWATATFDNVGAVQGWELCLMEREEKARCLSHVRPRCTGAHWWGYALTRRAWRTMRPVMTEYLERFLGDGDGGMDHDGIRRFIHETVEAGRRTVAGTLVPEENGVPGGFLHHDVATGNDALHALAMWRSGLVRLCTVVNRALPIGPVGLHCTEEVFAAMGMDRVQLDEFDEGRTLDTFELMA